MLNDAKREELPCQVAVLCGFMEWATNDRLSPDLLHALNEKSFTITVFISYQEYVMVLFIVKSYCKLQQEV